MNVGQVVDAGDARIHVDVSGSGEPIVLLHGFTGSAAAMAPLTQHLVDGFRVIVPDLVGHGRSSVPDELDSYTVGSMVRHVLAVADGHGCETFHLVGYSMGGRIALDLGCHFGHRLRSLVLIGTSAGLADEEARARRRRTDEDLARLIETDLDRFVDRWMDNPMFAGQKRLGDDFLATARAQRLASDPNGLAASLRAAGTGSMTPLHDHLGTCTVPTMLVAGGDDEKFRAIAAELSVALPHSATAIIAGAGHSAHLEQPVAVATRIRDFVSAGEGS